MQEHEKTRKVRSTKKETRLTSIFEADGLTLARVYLGSRLVLNVVGETTFVRGYLAASGLGSLQCLEAPQNVGVTDGGNAPAVRLLPLTSKQPGVSDTELLGEHYEIGCLDSGILGAVRPP